PSSTPSQYELLFHTSSLSFYVLPSYLLSFFFFNDTATTEIYTLSLHDALPICRAVRPRGPTAVARSSPRARPRAGARVASTRRPDRKSTRLNSSHVAISYAVFCLKKKKKNNTYYQKQVKRHKLTMGT